MNILHCIRTMCNWIPYRAIQSKHTHIQNTCIHTGMLERKRIRPLPRQIFCFISFRLISTHLLSVQNFERIVLSAIPEFYSQSHAHLYLNWTKQYLIGRARDRPRVRWNPIRRMHSSCECEFNHDEEHSRQQTDGKTELICRRTCSFLLHSHTNTHTVKHFHPFTWYISELARRRV